MSNGDLYKRCDMGKCARVYGKEKPNVTTTRDGQSQRFRCVTWLREGEVTQLLYNWQATTTTNMTTAANLAQQQKDYFYWLFSGGCSHCYNAGVWFGIHNFLKG